VGGTLAEHQNRK